MIGSMESDSGGFTLLFGALQAPAFAMVSAQQQNRKDQSTETEPGKHDLAGGISVRGVA